MPLVKNKVYVGSNFYPGYLVNNLEKSWVITVSPEFSLWDSIYHNLDVVYIAVSVVFIMKIGINLLSFFAFVKPFRKDKRNGFIYVKTDIDISPFSFMRYIVYNPAKFTEKELENILRHEREHSKQKHSYDILLVELLRAFQWINPIAWLYKNAIVQNLEFLADSRAINDVEGNKNYQLTMLKLNSAGSEFELTNNFYDSLIKRRISMLNKQRSKRINIMKAIIIIPLLIVFVFEFNTEVIAQDIDPASISVKGLDSKKPYISYEEEPLVIIDGIVSELGVEGINAVDGVRAEVIEGDEGIKRYGDAGKNGVILITTNKNKPEKQFNFSTEKREKKHVTDKSAEQEEGVFKHTEIENSNDGIGLKSKYNKTDEKVIPAYQVGKDIIRNSGRRYYRVGMPIEKADNVFEGRPLTLENAKSAITAPLYIVDGVIKQNLNPNEISPDDIEFISVLKGESAVAKYGDKGKNGVVEITMKKK